jgi:SAM-dependent methyltransferase
MDIKKYTEANRAAWNEVTPIHQKARKVDLKSSFATPGFSTLDETITGKLLQLGIKGKKTAQLCCNNGRETISMVNIGAAEAVGFDISDEAIREAEQLAKIAGISCRFVRADVYDIDDSYNNQFDLVLITIGALYWLPDLSKFFKIVRGMLNESGRVVIYESHPFTNMLAIENEKEFDKEDPLKIVHTYFREEPWIDDEGIDYIGKTIYKSKTNYGWAYKLSDIFNSIIESGLIIREFHEYRTDISDHLAHLDSDCKAPLSYLLVAGK